MEQNSLESQNRGTLNKISCTEQRHHTYAYAVLEQWQSRLWEMMVVNKKEKTLITSYAAIKEAKTCKRARKEMCYIYKGSHVVQLVTVSSHLESLKNSFLIEEHPKLQIVLLFLTQVYRSPKCFFGSRFNTNFGNKPL